MNTDLPKVSIGLVTYNHGAFIVECLDSIRRQSYPNIELLISDDCSRDDTVAVIAAYQKQYPDFIAGFTAQPENLGIAGNCNFLLRQFTGKYGQIFAGDDVMLPDKIARQVALLEADANAVVCFSNMEWFWSETNKKICNHFGVLQKPSTDIDTVLQDFSVPTPTLLARTDVMQRIGYEERLPYLNDCFIVMRLMAAGGAVYLPEIAVRYRKHKGSLTLRNYFYEDRQKLMLLLREFLAPEHHAAIARYRYTIDYAEIMTLIQQGRKGSAVKKIKNLLPVMFTSRKWLARMGAIAVNLLR